MFRILNSLKHTKQKYKELDNTLIQDEKIFYRGLIDLEKYIDKYFPYLLRYSGLNHHTIGLVRFLFFLCLISTNLRNMVMNLTSLWSKSTPGKVHFLSHYVLILIIAGKNPHSSLYQKKNSTFSSPLNSV